jgi:hypothetical protein
MRYFLLQFFILYLVLSAGLCSSLGQQVISLKVSNFIDESARESKNWKFDYVSVDGFKLTGLMNGEQAQVAGNLVSIGVSGVGEGYYIETSGGRSEELLIQMPKEDRKKGRFRGLAAIRFGNISNKPGTKIEIIGFSSNPNATLANLLAGNPEFHFDEKSGTLAIDFTDSGSRRIQLVRFLNRRAVDPEAILRIRHSSNSAEGECTGFGVLEIRYAIEAAEE